MALSAVSQRRSTHVNDCLGVRQRTEFALRPRRNPSHYTPSGLVPNLTSADFDMVRQLYTFNEIGDDDDDSVPEWIDNDDDDSVPLSEWILDDDDDSVEEQTTTERDLSMILKTRNSEKDGDQEEEEGEIICAVCQEELHQDKDCKIATLECRHEFHQDCVTKWLQNKAVCPICRKQLGQQD